MCVGCAGTPNKDTLVERIKSAEGAPEYVELRDEGSVCFKSEDDLIKTVGKPDSRVKTGNDPSDELWTWQCSDGSVQVPVGGIGTKHVMLWRYQMNTY